MVTIHNSMSAFDEYHDLAARLMGRDDFPLPLPEMDRNYPHNVGLLSDAEESELTALVLKHTRGMMYADWKQLDLEQRLPWVRLAVEDAGVGGADDSQRKADVRASLADRAGGESRIVESDEITTWPEGLLEELVADGTLVAIENAKSVTCDACGDDHLEKVEYLESPPKSGLRAYITCPTVGRVFVPLDRLRRWSISQRKDATGQPATPQVIDDPLSERAQHVLIAMVEHGAIDSDHRLTTDDIAAKALGGNADANALKGVMSELKTRQYVQSKTGRGGGGWLTDKGRVRAEKLRNG